MGAIGAIGFNFYLFKSFNGKILEMVSQKEGVIESLKRQLEERGAADVPVPAIESTVLPKVDFIESDVLPTAPELLKSVTLQKIVQAALKSLKPRMDEYNIRVAEKGLQSIPVTTDALQLQTAIEEVLKNGIEAMQFSRDRWLTISGSMRNGQVVLTVEDTGVGIAKDSLEKVFDPFFSTKDSQGVSRGLGLNVTRRVLEELKGTVSLKSHQSETSTGTIVRMEWPLPDSAAVEQEASPASVSELDLLADNYARPAMATTEWPDVPVRKPIVRTLD